jgi:hypothetical protein
MSSQKGYSTQEKDDRLSAQFQTIEPVRELQYGSTVVSHQFVYLVDANVVCQAGTTAEQIIAPVGHPVLKGDVLLILSTAQEVKVWDVDGQIITLAETLPAAPAPTDIVSCYRHKYPLVDSGGQLITSAVEQATAASGDPLPTVQKVIAGYDYIGNQVHVISTDAVGVINTRVVDLPPDAATETTLATLATEATVATLATEATLATLATQATVATLATEATVATLATQATVATLATEATVSTLATQATVATLATEATVSTLATQATVATLATEATVATLATAAAQTDGTQKSQLVDGAGDVADVVLLSTNLQGTDKGLVTNTIIHGETTGGGGGYVDVKVTPSGAMTTESTLAGLDAAVLGQDTMANSLPVVIASDQTAIKVTDGAGNAVATETTLAAIKTAVELIDNAISGNELQVDVVTSALPAGAATEATLASVEADTSSLAGCVSGTEVQVDIVAALPSGTNNIGDVDVASIVASTGRSAVTRARHVYSSTPVTTATYQQLVASLPSAVNEIEIFDSSGETLVIATGAISSEVDQVYVFPGGNGRIPLAIASGARVSVKAVSATASAGEIAINFYS